VCACVHACVHACQYVCMCACVHARLYITGADGLNLFLLSSSSKVAAYETMKCAVAIAVVSRSFDS
jgi:hypothetical protein